MGVGSEDDIVLDCYRLAAHYHQHPDTFLQMPLSEVQLHLYRTVQLVKLRQKLQSEDDG